MKIIVPTSWQDVKVNQYDELRQYDLDTTIIFRLIKIFETNDLKNLIQINHNEFINLIKALSILIDVSEENIYKMDIESLKTILNKLSWIKPIKINSNCKIPFNKILVGQFVDLESIIDNGFEKNFIKFSNKLFGKDMSEQPITQVYGEVYGYFNWRKKLFEDFKGLFEEDEDSDQEIKDSSEIKYTNFNRKWNWYGFIYKLAGGDILKMEAVTEINTISAFNFLAYEKEKSYLK